MVRSNLPTPQPKKTQKYAKNKVGGGGTGGIWWGSGGKTSRNGPLQALLGRKEGWNALSQTMAGPKKCGSPS